MRGLTITNSQAALADFFIRELAEWLASQIHVPVEFVQTGTWDEREARLDAGEIDLGWICGAPFVQKLARGIRLHVIAAPIMAHPRYQGRPIYFSDVVVRADSAFHRFEDLAGARWAFNEPHSHSGYQVVRHYMGLRGWNRDFFGQVIASGAHQTSVELVIKGATDGAAIDSTVLELLGVMDATPKRLRVIESIGPSPMPPFVMGAHVPGAIAMMIQETLTHMHETPTGRDILGRANMMQLARVTDADYDEIRRMLKVAETVKL